MIRRFDRLEITTTDLADAASTYRKNFGFDVAPDSGSDEATIIVAESEIRLRSGPAVADLIAAAGEGLAGIWLEADDVYQVAAVLQNAGVVVSAVRSEGGRRFMTVAPESANMVRLFVFDRR